ncbi:hypothetical protein QBC35DRAFT_45070 [Podospora australis]|uniref:Uncharacterized protein n=1 Tax=Podospora australis TaxID=1536484 RepID=A0AAN7AMK3_9PEZI|nr:hypothetical protein QBC35DRAFT_45070 [Podospora australis]
MKENRRPTRPKPVRFGSHPASSAPMMTNGPKNTAGPRNPQAVSTQQPGPRRRRQTAWFKRYQEARVQNGESGVQPGWRLDRTKQEQTAQVADVGVPDINVVDVDVGLTEIEPFNHRMQRQQLPSPSGATSSTGYGPIGSGYVPAADGRRDQAAFFDNTGALLGPPSLQAQQCFGPIHSSDWVNMPPTRQNSAMTPTGLMTPGHFSSGPLERGADFPSTTGTISLAHWASQTGPSSTWGPFGDALSPLQASQMHQTNQGMPVSEPTSYQSFCSSGPSSPPYPAPTQNMSFHLL